MSTTTTITFQAELQRKDPQSPVYILIAHAQIISWNLTKPTSVGGAIDGYDIGRRVIQRLHYLANADWFLELTLPFCRLANIKVGDQLNVTLHLADKELPTASAALPAPQTA